MIKNKTMKKTLFSFLFLISILPIHSVSAISIIPEVQENLKSNYSCTIIMKEFEQLYDFGYKSISQEEANQQIEALQVEKLLIQQEATSPQNITRIAQIDAEIKVLSNSITKSANQKFTCATKDLNEYLTTKSWDKITCDPAKESDEASQKANFTENDILGCSIITGRIRFAYVPRFIVYALELLTILSGVLSLLFVVLGGYYYLINSLSGGDMDKGKSYIKNAIIGLIVSLSAWSVINLVQLFFTS